ncbi:MAG: hypothetical protein ACON5B_06170 [Myxococcota bacterium]
MEWRKALDRGVNAFREQGLHTPGWYWVCRPQLVGRRSYDVQQSVRCLVYVKDGGELLSPLADMRTLDDVVCHDDRSGEQWVTLFAGPVRPADESARVRAGRHETPQGQTEVTVDVDGDLPAVGQWWWCRTNDEAPLMLVDHNGIGPILLHAGPDQDVHVFLAEGPDGSPVDVGEFGFSEPLVSEGGVIDSTGMLGRDLAVFHGAVELPASQPGSFPTIS